jgi:hypothetical protein
MRINLKVPFSQKDAAKELGARWDATRKIWYVVDPECVDVFSDWMPEVQAAAAEKIITNAKPGGGHGAVTGPKDIQLYCECDVLPWEHCTHTRASVSAPFQTQNL